MLADALDVFGGDLFAVTDALLNEIGGILGLPVIIEPLIRETRTLTTCQTH